MMPQDRVKERGQVGGKPLRRKEKDRLPMLLQKTPAEPAP